VLQIASASVNPYPAFIISSKSGNSSRIVTSKKPAYLAGFSFSCLSSDFLSGSLWAATFFSAASKRSSDSSHPSARAASSKGELLVGIVFFDCFKRYTSVFSDAENYY